MSLKTWLNASLVAIVTSIANEANEQFKKHKTLRSAKDAACDAVLDFVLLAQEALAAPGASLKGMFTDRTASGSVKGLIVAFFGIFILLKLMGPTVPSAYADFNTSINSPTGSMAGAATADKSNISSGMSLISLLPLIFMGVVFIRILGN